LGAEGTGLISSEETRLAPIGGLTVLLCPHAPPSNRHSINGGPSTRNVTLAEEAPTDCTLTDVMTLAPGGACITLGERLKLKLCDSLKTVNWPEARRSPSGLPVT